MRRSAGGFLLRVSLGLVLLAGGSSAQSFQDLVRALGITEFVHDYLQPGADAVGFGINSGMYHTARVDTGFHLWFGLKTIWTVVPDGKKTFTAKVPAWLTQQGYLSEIVTATVFGGKGAVLTGKDASGNPLQGIQLPDGTGLDQTFLFIPQMTVGSFAATELTLRGIPAITYDPEIGKVSFFGAGLHHEFTRYIRLPVSVSGILAAQTMKVGDILDVLSLSASANLSFPVLFATPFCGVGYESYTIDVSYRYEPPTTTVPGQLKQPERIAMNFKSRNLRFTAGSTLTIWRIDLTGSYSFGIQNTFTFSAGIKL